MAMIDEFPVEIVSLATLHEHPQNYQSHPADQLAHICESIKRNGIYRPIVIASDNTILAGHGVAKAARQLALETVPVIRMSFGPNDPKAIKLLAGDNEISHLAEIDDRKLADLLRQVMNSSESGLLGTGYDEMMLSSLAFITRAEITNFDAAAEWVGMPEYQAGETLLKVIVSVPNSEARDQLMALLGSEKSGGNGDTWSTRWSPQGKEDLSSVRFDVKKKSNRLMPLYPIYVPSKGRYDNCLTAKFLIEDNTPFHLVVEPQEAGEYIERFGVERVLVLPWAGDDAVRKAYTAERGIENGGLIAVRNWIKEHSIAAGFSRHWQLDDNIRCIKRRWQGRRIPCDSGVALRAVEDFVDRYSNIAIAGLNYEMFVINGEQIPPFMLNVHVYSCTLVNNAIPNRWRSAYNDDTDICLQVLADGWCTVLMNAFLIFKVRTMVMKGGNTDDLYQGDGRLKMAKALERLWPGVVETKRRFRRPQHVIENSWRSFGTPLKLKPGIDLAGLPPNEYGLELVQLKPIKSETLRKLVEPYLGAVDEEG